MTQPDEQADPVSEPEAGTRDKPRDDARAIVDALEAKLDEQYPDRTDPGQQEEEPAPDVEPGAKEKPGAEPPD